ncbi:MAG: TRAP transporter TatT component family protein [Candidatus Bipolaricaulota bacterium]
MKHVVLVFLLVALSAFAGAADPAADLLAAADAALAEAQVSFDFDAYRGQLETAISLWEEALPLLAADDRERRAHALNGLARAYFELAEAYLEAPAEREADYKTGSDYALASLRLDPTFVATEAADGFRAALYSASDVGAIFWYGNTIGQWYNYHQIQAIFSGIKDILASYERAVELDETYLGGGPHRSLAAFIAQAYFVLGKTRDECVEHYERAMEIDSSYLETYVNYAEHYAKATGRDELFSQLLATVDELGKDPAVVAAWPFYNYLALRRAAQLRP